MRKNYISPSIEDLKVYADEIICTSGDAESEGKVYDFGYEDVSGSIWGS